MEFMPILYALFILGAIGLAFGIILGIADKKFHVEVDERVANVRACLPGANCGACGYVGCDAFAEAVAAGEANPNGCSAGGGSTARAIGDVLGVAVEEKEPIFARVICQGTNGIAKARFEYDGYRSCRVAASIAGGPKQCRFSCIGLGDCALTCKFDAITMRDGIAYISEDRCVGCGACVDICPRNVIQLHPASARVLVRCRNSDVARQARDVCMKACIACKRCVKECKYDAIAVENGFAVIDNEKCTKCGDCVAVCPCNCITISDNTGEK